VIARPQLARWANEDCSAQQSVCIYPSCKRRVIDSDTYRYLSTTLCSGLSNTGAGEGQVSIRNEQRERRHMDNRYNNACIKAILVPNATVPATSWDR
jgi:hypothetical protein